MKIICDSCGTKYSISDDKVRGKVFKIRCKKCSHIIVVRGGESQDEAAAAAPAAAAAADGGWHIVVEGEQVGPISEADVRARVERGEIRGDTYIWKEGFADWLKLSAVPEFADIAPPDSGSVNIGDVFASDGAVAAPTNGSSERSGGRRRSGANRPLFGDDGGGADIFAAPAAAAPSSGGDLFGSASAHSTASNWPSSSGGGGGGASMAGHDGGRVENLTGQRHENSVLFSLSNLQSLAMPSAKPSTTASADHRADDRRLRPDRHSRDGGQLAPRGVRRPDDDDGRRSAVVRRVLARGARAAADAGVERPALVDLPGHRRHARPGRRHRVPRVARDQPEAGRGREGGPGARARARAVEDGRREDARCRGQEADHHRREGSAPA